MVTNENNTAYGINDDPEKETLTSAEPESEEEIKEVSSREIEETEKYANSLPVDDQVRSYFTEINQHRLLNADEEAELAVKAAGGDRDARDRLIQSNLRLVVSIAKRYVNRGLPLMDLIQEGNIGLIKAVEKYDPAKSRLSTYASYWINQFVRKAVAEKAKSVHIPDKVRSDFNAAVGEAIRESEKTGRITIKDIAAKAGVTETQAQQIIGALMPELSIDTQREDLDSLKDRIPDETVDVYEEVNNILMRDSISDAMRILDIKSRHIVQLRYGLIDGMPHTLDEVGTEFHLSRERVRQVEDKALKKLTAHLAKNGLQ